MPPRRTSTRAQVTMPTRAKEGNVEDTETRFWNRVNTKGPIHPIHGMCWKWLGRTECGYGRFYFKKRVILAHRYSWVLHYGEIPDNLAVLHKCDNRACANPKHLFLGDGVDNRSDCVQKKRHARGGAVHTATATEEQVTEIRKRYVKNCPINGCAPLSREFGLSYTIIRNIVNNKTWRCLLPS